MAARAPRAATRRPYSREPSKIRAVSCSFVSCQERRRTGDTGRAGEPPYLSGRERKIQIISLRDIPDLRNLHQQAAAPTHPTVSARIKSWVLPQRGIPVHLMSESGHQRPKGSVQRGGLCPLRSETDHELDPRPLRRFV